MSDSESSSVELPSSIGLSGSLLGSSSMSLAMEASTRGADDEKREERRRVFYWYALMSAIPHSAKG